MSATMFPRRVLLFSGHLVDAPGREPPRLPESLCDVAGRRLAQELAGLDAGPQDLAYTQGACGGDLLFSEACLARGVPLRWLQPFEEAEFIERSVALRGAHWRGRYDAARARLDAPPQAMPQHPDETVGDPFERCNQWLLERALSHGPDRLRVILLWNGEGGDGRGGTAHLMQLAKALGHPAVWIDTRRLRPDAEPAS